LEVGGFFSSVGVDHFGLIQNGQKDQGCEEIG
jgi:hypothetical protein